ncbi:hypothetical protein AQUCO_00700161v1 [Aquilegia coerulea]|uniref:BZIP domain-containing protein n=1 Tax=Aquilegia coerulea TaxID=218851 RepID=A0A2G5EIR3_AQUCA|nr:hypothetical protein AQUCO_00700161v1 [Aquilegia coerulea]PIA55654.1 hypothetical protein AQUCO_00700161v1 [Aquilegia coerulea]
MGSAEESTPAKPSRPSASSQETPPTPLYPDWSTPMQAYYGAGATQPPFFPTNVASPPPYPYMWGGQMVSPYGTPIPYPAIYPHGGLYPHPNLATAQGAAMPTTQMEENNSPVKKIMSSGNIGVVGGKLKESGKAASGSRNDGVSRSAESGSEGSSDASDEFNHKDDSENKNKSFDQMLADGANAQNTSAHHSSAAVGSSLNGNGEPSANFPVPLPGNPVGDIAATNLNIGMDLWNASPVGSVPLRARSNASGVVPAVAPVKRDGHEGIVPEHLWGQDERELKRQRRKLSNRESARRSRLRKQAECEELQVKVDTLTDENDNLRKELERLAEERQKLTNENASLESELSQLYGEEAISTLKGKNANMSVQSVNGFEQDTLMGNNSLSE